MHSRQIIKVDVEAPPIFERPMLTKHNFQNSPAYLEWRQLIDESKNIKNAHTFDMPISQLP